VWKKEIGQGFSAPVAAQGKLIIFYRSGGKETVEALDPETGKKVWSFDYATAYRDDFGFDEGPRATPSVDSGRVYTFGAEGQLHAIDLATGKKLWSVDTYRQFKANKGWFGSASSPLVDSGKVLLNAGGTAGIAAFDAATGKVLWTATGDEASYSSPAMATIAGERLALFLTRTGLAAIDPSSGKVRYQHRWRSRSQASVNSATPLAVGDRIFLSASYGTGAVLLDAAGGKLKTVWSSDDAMSNHYSTCVYRDGYLYGFHGRQEEGQSLRSVEFNTGKVAWNVDRFGAGTVTLAGDRLLIVRENGEIMLAEASPKAFKEVSRAKALPGTVRAYPALSAGRLYLRNEGTLLCLDLRKPS
jgi:outer membrane protein assembly factor BamB